MRGHLQKNVNLSKGKEWEETRQQKARWIKVYVCFFGSSIYGKRTCDLAQNKAKLAYSVESVTCFYPSWHTPNMTLQQVL